MGIDRDVDTMLNRIAQGESAGAVLDAVLPLATSPDATAKMRSGHLVCPKCGNESPDASDACRTCASPMARMRGSITIVSRSRDVPDLVEAAVPDYVIPEPLPDENLEDRRYVLADLRPHDRFKFLKKVPSTDVDLSTEYQIVPARRGAIAFSNQSQKVVIVPLIASHVYAVTLLSDDSVDPGHRYYQGDKIEHRTEGWRGTVLRHNRDGYYVRPEADGDSDDGSGVISVGQAEIRLVDKMNTTRNYIRVVDGGKFRVQWGGEEDSGIESRLVDALRVLYARNRTAFNRFSRLLSEESSILGDLDRESLMYLGKVDRAFWGRPGRERK